MKKLILLLVAGLIALVTGCQSMSDAAQKVSDDLGDKALQAHALVTVLKVTPSDPATNSSPTLKQITVIGDIKSIPLVAKNGELIKNYAEYRYTETPAWYNSSNVTKEEVFVATGDNVDDLKKWVEARGKLNLAPPAKK